MKWRSEDVRKLSTYCSPQNTENSGDGFVTAGETETDVLYNATGSVDQLVNTKRTCLSLSAERQTKRKRHDSCIVKRVLRSSKHAITCNHKITSS